MSSETDTSAAAGRAEPRPAAVTFVTTEHFTLQGARAATIAESTGRATMFLGSVSAGLVALGLIAAATRIGTTFYAFGVILLSTLSFVGFVTFERVLQSGIEDHGYAERIARLRAYYFDCAPEITSYLASVPPPQRLAIQGLRAGRRDGRRGHGGTGWLYCRPDRCRCCGSFRSGRLHHGRRGGSRRPGRPDALSGLGLGADPSAPILRRPAYGRASSWPRGTPWVTKDRDVSRWRSAAQFGGPSRSW